MSQHVPGMLSTPLLLVGPLPRMWAPGLEAMTCVPVDSDSWTPDGTEQSAAMRLHGWLKCAKAGWLGSFLIILWVCSAARGPVCLALALKVGGAVLQWYRICTAQAMEMSALELWKHSKYKGIVTSLQLLGIFDSTKTNLTVQRCTL